MVVNEEQREHEPYNWRSRVARERQDLSLSVEETLGEPLPEDMLWQEDGALIKSGSGGYNWALFFYGCAKHKGCTSVQFHAGFEAKTKPEWKLMNAFNVGNLAPPYQARLGTVFNGQGYDSFALGYNQVQAGTDRLALAGMTKYDFTDWLRYDGLFMFTKAKYDQLQAPATNSSLPSPSRSAKARAWPHLSLSSIRWRVHKSPAFAGSV